MMMTNHRWTTTLTIATMMLGGCTTAQPSDDAAAIGEALELENGGLDMDDEVPLFGDLRFDELSLSEVQPELVDPMETAVEVALMRERPDAVVVHAQIHWGQLRWNPSVERPRNWTGMFVVNRGAIIARRTVLFEEPTDGLLPRSDRRVLPFTSATRPHHDGIVVTIIDPEPESPEPLTLAYVNDLPGEAGPEGGRLAVPVRSLLDGPRQILVDELGNRMVAAATAQPVDLCERGFIAGRWHRVDEDHGVFIGQVRGHLGGLRGHLRGIWGARPSDGARVFFGKYIDTDGVFRGLLRGTYADGRFEGRWLDRSGERGAIGGEYREDAPGPEVGGHFLGAWRELSCDR